VENVQRKEKGRWHTLPREKQSGVHARDSEGAAKEGGREVQRTFKMLKEVWLDIGIERTDTHKGITIKMLLDSGATGMFMNRKTAAKHGFRLQKLERPVRVKNVNRTYNSRGDITHKVEVNVY